MRTYRAGSLTLTNASTSIVGVGTAFVANVAVGDIVVIENGQCLEVVSVPDDTHLTVSSPAKQSGSFNYAALRFVTAVNFRDLSVKIEQFLADRQFSLGEFSDWMSGTLTGGPNGDGRYPMTDRNGVTKLFMCPLLIAFGYQDSLDQAAFAAASATAALGSKNAAATSATNAAGSATSAATQATNAAGSATAANTSKNAAASSETAANTSKNAAATSATSAATSETNSANSATAAAGSASAALSSKNAAAISEANAAASATSAAAGSTGGLDKMPSNLISNPTFISTASLFEVDNATGTINYVDAAHASVPAGCPTARVGKSLKKVASTLLSHAFPLANAVDRIPCIPGEKFDVCIWMNVVGGPATGSAAARLVFVESDAVDGGAFVANTRVLSYDQVVGGWQKLVGTYTANTGVRSFTIGVWNETAMPVNGTIFFAEPELTRRNSVMGLLGSLGFGLGNSPLITDMDTNKSGGPFSVTSGTATAFGLPHNVAYNGIQLRQSTTSNLQIVAPISSNPTIANKLFWRNSFNGGYNQWLEVAANSSTLTDMILSGETVFAKLTTDASDDTLVPTSSDTGTAPTPALRVSGLGATGNNTIAVQGYSYSTANFGSSFVGTRSQGAVGAHGAVPTNRSVCTLVGAASDGADYRKVGRIDLYTEELATATSSAGSVRVLTTPVGSVTPALVATFTSDKRLVVVGGGSFGGDLAVTGNIAVTGTKSITTDYRMGVNRNASVPYLTFSRTDLVDGTPPVSNSQILLIDGKTGAVGGGDFASGRTLGSMSVNYNTNGGGTTIVAARNSSNATTVSIVMDGETATNTVTGIIVALGKIDARGAIDEATTVNLASATTTNIAGAAANAINITGTVAIGALGTATAGVRRITKFTGVLVLAHNATSMILPTGANITTAPNDIAEWLSLGSGNWICTAYNRISGKPLNMENVDNTSDANKPISTAVAAALAGKQASLGYTPPQQGTGTNQLNNIIKIGWSTVGKVKITVDATDQGNITFEGVRHFSPNFEASAYTEAKGFANQTATDAPFVVKTQALNAASEYIPIIKMRATIGVNAESISMGVLSDPAYQSMSFHWGGTGAGGQLLNLKRDGTLAQFSGAVNAGTSFYAPTTINAGTTINATGGCYNNGQMTWSRADLNPTALATLNNHNIQAGSGGKYNLAVAPNYQNYTAEQQVYTGAIEIREAGLVAAGGAAPGHMYNAPAMTFHWAGYAVNKLMMVTNGNLAWGNPSSTYSQITVDGNIYGNTWGGWLSTWINAYCLTTGNFRTRFADVRAGELGSYALAACLVGGVGLGIGVAGSNLRYSATSGSNPGAALPGSYDCCGYINTALEVTLWHRYV